MTDELIERIEAADRPDRALDAEIACALHDGNRGDPDDRNHTRARIGNFCHGSKPGNYEIHAFSGVSMATAPLYTAATDKEKAMMIFALKARKSND